jgi:signal transduction histidine kinase/ActR/RegA family two-component response regulator
MRAPTLGDGSITGVLQARGAELPGLGPLEHLEPALRILFSMLLELPTASALVWGAERRLLYNDGFSAFLGERHPAAFGEPLDRAWPEAAPVLEAAVLRLLATPTAVDGPLLLQLPVAAHALACTPARDEQGAVRGALLTCAGTNSAPTTVEAPRVAGDPMPSVPAADKEASEGELQHLNRVLEHRVQARTAELEDSRRHAIALANRLQFTLDAAQIGDWDLDLVTDAARRSLRHDQIFGHDEPIPEWGFAQFIGRVHPDDREPVKRHFEGALQGHGDWNFECRIIWPDQSIHWIAAHGTVYLRGDEPQRMSGIVYDITERKQAEGELRNASERKDEFLAMLAHELRNPLAPIGTAAQLLQRTSADPAAVERASAIISRQVAHMTTLIDDLLDVSRVTRGLVTLEMQPLELASIVAGAIEQARPMMEARRHLLTTRIGPDAMTVVGDRTRLIQVVTNLLNNAAKYTPHGGLVELRAAIDGDAAQLVVQDNGHGIDPQLLPDVFELFTQGDRALDRSQGGLGIGLALVRSIVQVHGGTVTAHSEGAERGSCFTVRLPLSAEQLQSPFPEASAATMTPGAPIRVLVVDDNRDAATSIAELLGLEGHVACVAHDARSALRIVVDSPAFHAFILDIGLPDMTGHALAARLREQSGTGAVYIAVTGYGQPQDILQSQQAGFDHHLVKPVDTSLLIGILRERASRVLSDAG